MDGKDSDKNSILSYKRNTEQNTVLYYYLHIRMTKISKGQ